MSTEKKEVMNPLRKLEQEVSVAKNVKDILKINLLADRYIANYQAISGREDGRARFEREAFAFIELVSNKPDIMDCDPFSVMAGFIKAGVTGLSFTDGKLSVYPRGVKQKDGTYKKNLVVEPDAHGKKEMLERMPTIKKIDEGVVVFRKDVFVYDPHKKQVSKHEQAWPVPNPSEETVIGAYCTIHFSDNHTEDIVLSLEELKKARSKSKMKDGGELWVTFYGEACKKSTYNRAFKVHHKMPSTVFVFPEYEGGDDDVDKKLPPQNNDAPDFSSGNSGNAQSEEESSDFIDAEVVDEPIKEEKTSKKKTEAPKKEEKEEDGGESFL